MKKETNESSSHAGGIVLGITALAAAAAGAYYLYGSDDAKKNRRQLKSWALRMKADVMDEIENMKDVTEENYNAVVEKVSKKYAELKDMDRDELAELVDRMKSHWKDIKAEVMEEAHEEHSTHPAHASKSHRTTTKK
jgi:gas vesicle protein